ncbi:MAG: LLM class flavin-dependent oxidoreductase, partial [Thermoanaerobaculia bacterium]
MNLGLFQLLPRIPGGDDRDLVAQALREIDLAEEHGFHSLWVTEHHGSCLGSIGVPSVYAAAVAQRTRRLRIGCGVAVLPLHHPLRLAEEIAWVDHLSGGRLLVGAGAGFSQDEFAALGVPLAERHERLEEGLAILRGVFTHEVFAHEGRFWRFPPFTLRPRPYTRPHPPLLRAASSPASVERAAADGTPLLLGTRSAAEIGDFLDLYRQVRTDLGVPAPQVEEEIGAAW